MQQKQPQQQRQPCSNATEWSNNNRNNNATAAAKITIATSVAYRLQAPQSMQAVFHFAAISAMHIPCRWLASLNGACCACLIRSLTRENE